MAFLHTSYLSPLTMAKYLLNLLADFVFEYLLHIILNGHGELSLLLISLFALLPPPHLPLSQYILYTFFLLLRRLDSKKSCFHFFFVQQQAKEKKKQLGAWVPDGAGEMFFRSDDSNSAENKIKKTKRKRERQRT
jgi:hypothetical protein